MANIRDQILNKISENKTVNDICNELNISRKMLHYQLELIKNTGYCYTNTYFNDGNILLRPGYDDTNKPRILTDDSSTLKVLALSDVHFGSILSKPKSVELMFEYCNNKDIHIILMCGDVIDGNFGGPKIITDFNEQIDYFVDNYPYDPNIVTFGIMGDHDTRVIKQYNYNPAFLINKQRSDVVMFNSSIGDIYMNDSLVKLCHDYKKIGALPKTEKLILCGHNHKYRAIVKQDNTLIVVVPSLSRILNALPSALSMNIEFDNNEFCSCNITQLGIIDNRVFELNNIDYYVRKK